MSRKHTAKTKRKLSEAKKKLWADSIWREKQVRLFASPERCRKISKAMKRRKLSPEHRYKISEAKKGTVIRDEHRHKLSEAKKMNWADPEYREKQTKLRANLEDRRKRSEALTQAWANPARHRKMSETVKKLWMNPAFREKQIKAMKAGLTYVSKPQLALFQLIQQHYPTAECGVFKYGFECDIWIAEHKIDVEYDEPYWHPDPVKDYQRDKKMMVKGVRTLRVSPPVEEFDLGILHRLIERIQ